jgi:GGDEF domain-containing protein
MHADLDHDLAPQHRDPLTGLASLEGLMEVYLGAGSPHRARPSALALLDVRRFSEINEALGFELGDEALRALARRILERLPAESRGARVCADVFAVVGPREQVTPQFMRALLHPPLAVLEHDLPLEAAIGLCGPQLGEEPARVWVHRARAALGSAKRSPHGGDCAHFAPALEDVTRRRREILRELREAFVRGRLELWYQPQLALHAPDVVGIEALLRWPGG